MHPGFVGSHGPHTPALSHMDCTGAVADAKAPVGSHICGYHAHPSTRAAYLAGTCAQTQSAAARQARAWRMRVSWRDANHARTNAEAGRTSNRMYPVFMTTCTTTMQANMAADRE